MAERTFGLETEYAFTALDRRGHPLPRATVVGQFMEYIYAHEPNLPDNAAGGVFLRSGGRLYRDSGNHPELTTPEVVNPWDVCRYLRAGDRILNGHAQRFAAQDASVGQILLGRSNVSYGGAMTTWACHESYGHRANLATLPVQLIPFLVSRVIFTGAGGFDNRLPGAMFLLSPRVAHLHEVTSGESQANRGIYHTKDEPLAAGHHRLHILCGESNCSDTSNWLKTGVTAIVVALIEAGTDVGHAIRLCDPLDAMRTIAADIHCRAEIPALDGARWTAIKIQRHYLGRAERNLDARWMPAWAWQVCRRWREVLDQLEHGPERVAKSLDWGIKLAVYRQFAAREGLDWEKVTVWSGVLEELCEALVHGGRINRLQMAAPHGLPRSLFVSHGPAGDEFALLTGMLERHGLGWDGLDHFLNLREKLFELDTRYSQVGPAGLFASLDGAGVL
ncbi:MAG: proteasome accessory factor PafA2 family protein, partial [Planctomycetaceae bacterium]